MKSLDGVQDAQSFYKKQAESHSNGPAWLQEIREQGLKDFLSFGFPRLANEDWKYTPLDSFLRQKFLIQAPPQDLRTNPDETAALIFQDGVLYETPTATSWPPGLIVCSLAEALNTHRSLVAPYLDKILKPSHGFHALNSANLALGAFIYVPPNLCLDKPLRLLHRRNLADTALHLRHLVLVQSGATLTLIEEYQGAENIAYLTNLVTELMIEADAQVEHYKIQRESLDAYHFGHLAVTQGAKSSFASHLLSIGGKMARSDLVLDFQASGAKSLLNGIYVLKGKQHFDAHTQIHHAVADCASEQDYKGILMGQSTAVFNGQIHVAPGAQKTVAKQINKNLLLSPDAVVNTKPQLDIFADDVVCTHGATLGQLDEEALFYMTSRGIDRILAKSYLIQAFAYDNLQRISPQALGHLMDELLHQQLSESS